jgi:hypothetical protein
MLYDTISKLIVYNYLIIGIYFVILLDIILSSLIKIVLNINKFKFKKGG